MKVLMIGQTCNYLTMDVLTGKPMTIVVRINFKSPGFYHVSGGQFTGQIPFGSSRLTAK